MTEQLLERDAVAEEECRQSLLATVGPRRTSEVPSRFSALVAAIGGGWRLALGFLARRPTGVSPSSRSLEGQYRPDKVPVVAPE